MSHVVKPLLYSLAFLVVALLAYVGYYGLIREPRAEAAAHAFCDTVRLGESADAVLQRAEQSEAGRRMLRWFGQADGERTLLVMFVGLPPFSRHTCSVQAQGQRVTSARYVYLD